MALRLPPPLPVLRRSFQNHLSRLHFCNLVEADYRVIREAEACIPVFGAVAFTYHVTEAVDDLDGFFCRIEDFVLRCHVPTIYPTLGIATTIFTFFTIVCKPLTGRQNHRMERTADKRFWRGRASHVGGRSCGALEHRATSSVFDGSGQCSFIDSSTASYTRLYSCVFISGRLRRTRAITSSVTAPATVFGVCILSSIRGLFLFRSQAVRAAGVLPASSSAATRFHASRI